MDATPRDVGRAVRAALGQDLVAAQRAGDRALVRVQRTLLAAIDNAEAVAAPQAYDHSEPGLGRTEAARRVLDGDAVRALFRGELEERTAAAETYRRIGAHDDASRLDAEREVIAGYLDGLP